LDITQPSELLLIDGSDNDADREKLALDDHTRLTTCGDDLWETIAIILEHEDRELYLRHIPNRAEFCR